MEVVEVWDAYNQEKVGTVSLANGRAVIKDRKLAALLRTIFVFPPDGSGKPVTPKDGERYLEALEFSLRGGLTVKVLR